MMSDDPDESTLFVAPDDSAQVIVAPTLESPLVRRRADIDAKQRIMTRMINELECEAAILLMPAHIAWLTGGLTARGLYADTERPGIYTNGIQRWLIASNVDTLRLFDEEIDGLGFQLKEWSWLNGRGSMLGQLISDRKVAVDRPYPNLPLINEKLRTELRPLTAFEHEQMLELGRVLVHALEATGLEIQPGETEADVAGVIAHRLIRRGANVEHVSVLADDRGLAYRRAGASSAVIQKSAILQATAAIHGLHATASRTIHFGPTSVDFQKAYSTACKVSAVHRSMSLPGESLATASDAGRWLTTDTPFEFEYRQSQPGYGTGRFSAEELRRQGKEELFVGGQSLVWQTRIAQTAIVDTVIVGPHGCVPITPPELWPFKRIRLKDQAFDIPDTLIRNLQN